MEKVDRTRFSGFASLYDAARPQPPSKVVDIVAELRRGAPIDCVVDLGAGTGLSTAIWKGRAGEIIGIEPTADMRNRAVEKYPDLSFLDADCYGTGLASASVDVVTCSQSFHWMEPVSALTEAARILKDGGVFAAYDCAWPVVWNWVAENAYEELLRKVRSIAEKTPAAADSNRQYPKEEHLKNIRNSGRFRYARQILFDNVEPCDAERFIAVALSQGIVQTLIKQGVREIDKPLADFKRICRKPGGEKMRVCYVMNVGIK